jgi:hypothetical protein
LCQERNRTETGTVQGATASRFQVWFAFLRWIFFFAKIAENSMKNAQRLDESIGANFY